MDLIPFASDLIRSVFRDSKKASEFRQDFSEAFIDWIRPIFLKEDERLVKRLEAGPDEPSTQNRLEIKLEDLLEDPQFAQELRQWMERSREGRKNVVQNSEIDAGGDVHIGDRGASSVEKSTEKNILDQSTIKAKGNVRLGDDILSNVQVGGNFHLGDIIYQHPNQTGDHPDKAPAFTQARQFIARNQIEKAIDLLTDTFETTDAERYNDILQLSGRWQQLKRRERLGVLSASEAGVERNQIVAALLDLCR